MSAVVAILILLACLGLSFLPLLLPAAPEEIAPEPADPRGDLLRERHRLLEVLRELDMDLAMGKISEGDHASLRAGFEREAVDVLASLDELEGEEGEA